MSDFPDVPSCPPEDPCEALGLIPLGKGLVVTDPSSDCQKLLDGFGLALGDSQGVHFATGEPTNPVKLPKMQTLPNDSMFPFLIIMNKAGVFFALRPKEGTQRYILTSKNGSFMLEKSLNEPCFKDADICEDCEPDFISGIKVNDDGTACLIKLPLSSTIDFWENSNCIHITGTGTEEDPYIPNVVISPDDGNLLQCTSNGLFVAQPSS